VDSPNRKPIERTVGVYDRPPGADRPRWIRTAIIVVAVVIAVGLVVMYMSR
jgi:hypothetical protein